MVIPFILTLTFGKGYKELLEAATMNKYVQRRKEYFVKYGLHGASVEKPSVGKRVLNTIQTFLTYIPGLSWIPLPKEVTYAIDEDYNQTLLKRKMCELFGENGPQFILQFSIELNKRAAGNEILPYDAFWEILTKSDNWLAITTSLVGIILRSTDLYLGLCSKDKYGKKMEPYSTFKNKIIVLPLMTIAVLPRVLTYSTFLASSFPLFKVTNEDLLGIRFGLIVLISALVIYIIGQMMFGYFKMIQNKQLDWSEFILGGFSNLISPCLIQHQTSGLITYCSCFTVAHYTILLTALSITSPSTWNSSHQGTYYLKSSFIF